MSEAELLIAGLLVAVAGLSALARQLAIPYPIVLVTAARVRVQPGLPQGAARSRRRARGLSSPLLYGAAFFANVNLIRADLRSVTLSFVGWSLPRCAPSRPGRTSSSMG